MYRMYRSVFSKKIILIIFLSICLMVFGFFYHSPAHAKMALDSKGGVQVNDYSDDPYWFTYGASFFLDQAQYIGSQYDKQGDFPNGCTITYAYLWFAGGLGKNWSYSHYLNLVPDSKIIVPGLYVEYGGFKNTRIQMGLVFVPSAMENLSPNNDYLFIAPSLITGAFFPDYDTGFGVSIHKTFFDKFKLSVAWYQPTQGLRNYGDIGRSDRQAQAMRFYYSPIHTKTKILHLGCWGRHQSIVGEVAGVPVDPELAFEGFFNTPEADARNTGSLVDTGPFQANKFSLAGLEAGVMCGPFLIMSEYIRADVYRKYSLIHTPGFKSHVKFDGWYLQSGYVLTGESHEYDFNYGIFQQVKPTGCYGALEIAIRYSAIDLLDNDVYGGKEHNITLGLNWYINSQVRFAANYIHASSFPTDTKNPGTAVFPKRKLDIISFQLNCTF